MPPRDKMMKYFSIIIPTLDPIKNITRLLDNLKKIPEAKTHFDIIIVNNHDRFEDLDFSIRYGSSFYRFNYLTSGAASANIARNLGLRFSIGDFICFLDDDCFIDDESYFQKATQYFSNSPETVGIGGPYHLPAKANVFDKAYHEIAMHWLESSVDPVTKTTDNLIGGNSIYRGEVLKKGFNFDPSISYGSSELSLNFQLRAHGHILRFFPELSVLHSPRLSLFSFIAKAYKQGRGSANQIFKQPQTHYKNKKLLFKLYNLFFHLGFISHGRSMSFPQKIYRIFEFIQFVKFINTAWVKVMRLYWSSLPFWGWLRSLMGYLNGFFIKIRFRLLALIGWTKKYLILTFWYLEPKIKFPFIKLYFMTEYHWRTYIRPMLRKFGIKL
jgi:glycosyltransferase involved in cell wall biosynthesis